MKEFWQTCVSRLEQELPPQQISAWIRPLVPLAYDETQAVLRVAAPNRFKLDWVRKNFSHQIEALAAEWFERPVQVLFELPSQGATPRMPVAPVRAQQPAHTPLSGATPSGGAPPPGMAAQPAAPAAPAPSAGAAAVNADAANIVYERSRLNTDLTFENFVTCLLYTSDAADE